MVVDVIDIRKRIEKIRNDVSEAIVSQHDFEAREEALREDISLSISPDSAEMPATDAPELPLSNPAAEAGAISDVKPVSDMKQGNQTLSTHRAMTQMLSMPSFTLNVKNRHSNRLLLSLFAVQLITNLILIFVIINKL